MTSEANLGVLLGLTGHRTQGLQERFPGSCPLVLCSVAVVPCVCQLGGVVCSGAVSRVLVLGRVLGFVACGWSPGLAQVAVHV